MRGWQTQTRPKISIGWHVHEQFPLRMAIGYCNCTPTMDRPMVTRGSTNEGEVGLSV